MFKFLLLFSILLLLAVSARSRRRYKPLDDEDDLLQHVESSAESAGIWSDDDEGKEGDLYSSFLRPSEVGKVPKKVKIKYFFEKKFFSLICFEHNIIS
jgi:hypothetical protein